MQSNTSDLDTDDIDAIEPVINPEVIAPVEALLPEDHHTRNRALFLERARVTQRVVDAEDLTGLDGADEMRRATAELDHVTGRIVECNRGLVISYVRLFTGQASQDHISEYEQAGMLGLMKAISTYDPDRGKFAQWAYKPIQREVLRAVRTLEHPTLNPADFDRRPLILRTFNELTEGEETPSIEEVAQVAGVSIEQASRVLSAPRIQSLNAPVGEDSDQQLSDMLPATDSSVEDHVELQVLIESLQRNGLAILSARETYVLVRRYGLDCEPSQKLYEIGTTLNLSREAVRQIEAKGRSKLGHPSVLRAIVRTER